MSIENMEEKIRSQVHQELTTIMCAEQQHQQHQANQPLIPEIPTLATTQEEEPPVPSANAAVTTNEIKRLIQEVIKDEPYQNTKSKRQKKRSQMQNSVRRNQKTRPTRIL